jgi:membrane protease YdiL (CAAX protease family)
MLPPSDPIPDHRATFDVCESPTQPLPSRASVIRDAAVDSLALISVMFLFGIVFGIVALMTGGSAEALRISHFGDSYPWVPGSSLVWDLALVCFGLRRLAVNRQKGRPSPRLFEGDAFRGALMGIALGAALASVSIVYSIVIRRVFDSHAVPIAVQDLRAARSNQRLLLAMLFRAALLAPACEEFFFRAVIFGSARTIRAPWLGAGVGSVLFAAAHVDPLYSLFYFSFGMTMCWLLVRSRTLTAPIVAHITNNILACLLALRLA